MWVPECMDLVTPSHVDLSWVGEIPWKRDKLPTSVLLGFPGGSDSKESAYNAGDPGSIPGLGRAPGGGHGNPLQYSCLESPHGQRSLEGHSQWGPKSRTRLSDNTGQHRDETIQKNKYRCFSDLSSCEKEIMRQRKMQAHWISDVMAE